MGLTLSACVVYHAWGQLAWSSSATSGRSFRTIRSCDESSKRVHHPGEVTLAGTESLILVVLGSSATAKNYRTVSSKILNSIKTRGDVGPHRLQRMKPMSYAYPGSVKRRQTQPNHGD
ncbi:hypothetical protein VNO77_34662 [Canavalia gladiata]|uniref:Uncharacterized protein n=1 Tax=Canavalia gladiata TaxID=3824 RepID=A0AAN9KFF0_CANGL